jgi:hypothetical protein
MSVLDLWELGGAVQERKMGSRSAQEGNENSDGVERICSVAPMSFMVELEF